MYIPNGTVNAFTSRANETMAQQCTTCGADVSGNPLVITTTAFDGTFTLTNVPVGSAIPVVIQLGRWRRQFTVNIANKCVANTVLAVGATSNGAAIPSGYLVMPNKQSEGDIPFTAISTGNVDAMECVLLKMGVDPTEFTKSSGTGRIQMYQGNGASAGNNTPNEAALMDTGGTYNNYDQIILPCWGVDPVSANNNNAIRKSTTELADLAAYGNAGGHFFATHFSYTWLTQPWKAMNNGPFVATANWNVDHNTNIGSMTGVVNPLVPPTTPGTFVDWLNKIQALSNFTAALPPPAPADVTLSTVRHDVDSVAGQSVEWINGVDPGDQSNMLLHFTFDTPVNRGEPVRARHLQRLPRHELERDERLQLHLGERPRDRVRHGADDAAGEDPRVHDLGPRVVRARAADVHVRPQDVRELPRHLRRAGRRLRRPDGELRRLRRGHGLRRRGRREPVRRSGRRAVHAPDVLGVSDGYVRAAERRLRRPHAQLQQLPRGAAVRRRRRRRGVRSAGRRFLHAADVRGLRGHLRSADGRLRRAHARLQPLPRGSDLRRRRDAGPVRGASDARMHADHLPGADDRLRPGGRRVRRRDRVVRYLPGAPDVRRRRRSRPVRRQRQLRAGVVREPEHHLRPGGRRVRQPDPGWLRHVRAARHLRRRRRPRPVRRRRGLRAEDLPGPQRELRSRGRRLRGLIPTCGTCTGSATCGGGGTPGQCGMQIQK